METNDQSYSFAVQSITNDINPNNYSIHVKVEGIDGTSKTYHIPAGSSCNIPSTLGALGGKGQVVTLTLELPNGNPPVTLECTSADYPPIVKESSNYGDRKTLRFMPLPVEVDAMGSRFEASPKHIVALLPWSGAQTNGGILVIGTLETGGGS
ncbi:MAG: hypothetical protein AAGN35_19700 [Bacteroidota bacterium]